MFQKYYHFYFSKTNVWYFAIDLKYKRYSFGIVRHKEELSFALVSNWYIYIELVFCMEVKILLRLLFAT
jgi:hypothetical protein